MSVKRYYWLKLKEDFFTDPKIKKLRKIAGGDTYTIILQKIMLLAVKGNGVVEFQGIEKTLHEELSLILDEDEDNIQVTINFMLLNGIMEQVSGTDFLLPKVVELTGSETDSAERVRRFREKKNELPALQCNDVVTEGNEIVTTDIEIRDKREELEIEKRDKKKEYISEADFSISKETSYDRLSAEYKEALKVFIEQMGLSLPYQDFVDALQAKSYKYKNFAIAYRNWCKKDYNKGKCTTQYDHMVQDGKISKEVAHGLSILDGINWEKNNDNQTRF